MTVRNDPHLSVARPSLVPPSPCAEVSGRMGSRAHCLRCEDLVETRFVPSDSSSVRYVLAGLAAFFIFPELISVPVGTLILFSALFGAALALYVAWRRPSQRRVCEQCGSHYIYAIEHHESFQRRAA
jgi:hypothetical protein